MRDSLKRLALIPLGLAVGTGFSIAALGVYEKFVRPTRPIAHADQTALRRQLDDNPKAIYQFDPTLSYRLKPGYRGFRHYSKDLPHQTNSHGALGGEIDKSPARRNILFLGDSVTYGDGVAYEKIFTSLLQKICATNDQIINAACPGWSTNQEIGMLTSHLSDVNWNLVVLVFCLNDLVQFEWVYKSDETFDLSEELSSVGGLSSLNETAKALRLLAQRQSFGRDPRLAPLAGQNNTVIWAWDSDKWLDYESQVLKPWFTARRSYSIAVLGVPNLQQIRALALGADPDQVLFPQRRLAEICSRHDVRFLDGRLLLDTGNPATDETMFRDDLHLSEAGHERLARGLWPKLAEMLE